MSFTDGSSAEVFRETVISRPDPVDPCVLVVKFELRGVHGSGHAWFRRESLLNTVLFAGFPGLVSKLWLANDEHGCYRGVYEWDGPVAAANYARALWRGVGPVSGPRAIDYPVGARPPRGEFVARASRDNPVGWWQLAAISMPHGQ